MGSTEISLKDQPVNPLVCILQILGLTLIFYLTARLGLLLAIPPGYATAIWLPSGISLAFVLLFGYRIAPAIWLGSCWVNFEVSHHLMIAASIGLGSTLQALLGAYLVNRYVGFPNPLSNEREIAHFLLLGGPISCLVAASWGCTTLLLTQQIHLSNFLYNWFTWWAGDTIGVLVFTPLVLIWTAEPREIWRQRRFSLSLPLCIMFAIISLFIIYTNRVKQEKILEGFENQAHDYAVMLASDIKAHLEILSALSITLSGVSETNPVNLQSMIQSFSAKYPAIKALSWIPPASAVKDTQTFLAGYLSEKKVTARFNEKLFTDACLWNQGIAAPPFYLGKSENKWGLLIFQPIYHKMAEKEKISYFAKKDNVRSHCQGLIGYLVTFFQIDKLVQNAKILPYQKNIGLNIYDSSINGETLIYSSVHEPVSHVLAWDNVINVAGRKWHLQLMPTENYLNNLRGWEEWAVPLCSVLLMGLLGSLLLIVTGRATMIETVVALRTTELKISNQNLIREIAEREAIEEELAFHVKELASTNAELEQFAYIASHDMQEPLRMIVSYLHLLEQQYKQDLDVNAQQFITYATDSAIRLQELIRNLLNYSYLGKKNYLLTAVDSEQILEQVLQNLSVAIKDSGAIITHDPLPIVMAESSQLLQLFQNLIGNAIKFNQNSPILIHINAQKKKGSWVFSIQDNGIGIDPENFSRIFVLFQQLHNDNFPGSGIGLAVCKKIIEHLGGKIWVASKLEKGSIFYFSLPITPITSKSEFVMESNALKFY